MAKAGRALLRDVAIPANGNIPIEIFAAQAAARRRLTFCRRAAPFLSVLASSRMPTRMSPHRPIPARQSAQMTRLSSVELSGTTNLLLPHFGHLSGASGMARAVHSG
jgi:hypothetical protein